MFSSNTSAVSGDAVFIEDVMSTYLYTGNGSSQTITNGIDLSTKGGLVWLKYRTDGGANHIWTDTVRGATKSLYSNATDAQATVTQHVTGFTTSGFSVGNNGNVNDSGGTFASWTFRKQAKFFDVVTYTGTGSNTTISHSLGSVPACIMVKRTDTTGDWQVYHSSLANTEYLVLNTTAAKATGATRWNSTTPTSTVFSIGTDATVNASGGSYVAYLFAHDAGGFGLTGTDNVISCGSYTGNGAAGGQLINLGYEAQWVMIKKTSSTGSWMMFDTMRGWSVNGDYGSDKVLWANLSGEENDFIGGEPSSLGFTPIQDNVNQSGATYIYIAIRRGPMKVPTSGTSVYTGLTANNAQGTANTTNFPVDLQLAKATGTVIGTYAADRLRGVSTTSTTGGSHLITSSTAAEVSTNATQFWNNTGFQTSSGWASTAMVYWNFQRAPSFFDEVCYTGTGAGDNPRTFTHNLQVVPELMIIKRRNSTAPWIVYSASQGASKYATLNTTDAFATADEYLFNNTSPTASVFTVGSPNGASSYVNASGGTYVAYLFATCAGVSKVGSYTGTGTTKQVDCGFTGGARFVLIKRTDSTGDWYVWDTARGIVSGNDPYLLLNSTAAEVTNTDYVDTYSAGFEISSTAPAAINASGGSYIFLAVS